jgi:DNA modification methylase
MPQWENRIVETGEIDISKVILNPNNPKQHPAYQKQMLSGFIEDVGWVNFTIINKRTGHLVDGEGRYWSAIENDQKTLPVAWIDVSEEEELKILASLDTTTSFATINITKMTDVVKRIVANNDGMRNIIKAITQRNKIDITDVLNKNTNIDKPKSDGIEKEGDDIEKEDDGYTQLSDKNDEIMKKENEKLDQIALDNNIKTGDVWELAPNVFVMCGDSREKADILTLVSRSGALKNVVGITGVFTSPPYAMQRKDQYGGISEEEYVDWWELVQENCREIMNGDGNFFLNIKTGGTKEGQLSLYVIDLVQSMVRRWGWKLIEEYCWVKASVMPRMVTRRFKNKFEPVYQFSNSMEFKFIPTNVMNMSNDVLNNRGDGTGNTSWGRWQGKPDAESPKDMKGIHEGMAYPSNVIESTWSKAYGHEASFPEGLVEFFIKAYSADGDVWFDPFGGSGTTGVVCNRLGRGCIMMEKLPKYIAVMINRYKEELGSEPKRIYQL